MILLGLDYFLINVKPLRWINTSGFVPLDRNSVAGKIPEFLRSTENPDILLIGTSLILAPAVRCDDALEGRRTRYDNWYEWNHLHSYTKSTYLTKLLRDNFGTTFSIKNLGHAGGMMADQDLIFKNILKAGKHPKLVICCTSTRDFLDNNHDPIEQTPVFKTLANIEYLPDLLKEPQKKAEIPNFLVSSFWHYYKVRVDYRTIASMMATQFTGHPLSLYRSNQDKAPLPIAKQKPDFFIFDIKPDYTPKPNTLGDIEYLRSAYIPPNYKLFNQEAAGLNNLLRLAHDNQIPFILINMPITKEHKNLLAQGLHQRYLNTLESSCRKYAIPFYNLDQDAFYTHADFDDSSHLNRSGGEKFYARLVSILNQDKLTKEYMQQNKNILSGIELPSL